MEKISLKQSTVLRVCLEKAQILYQKGVHVHKYLVYPFAKSSVSPIKSKNALLKGRRIENLGGEFHCHGCRFQVYITKIFN